MDLELLAFSMVAAMGGTVYLAINKFYYWRFPCKQYQKRMLSGVTELEKYKRGAELQMHKISESELTLSILKKLYHDCNPRVPLPTPNYDLKEPDLYFARKIDWQKELSAKFNGQYSGPAAKVLLTAMSVVPSFSFSEDGMPEENPAEHYRFRYMNRVREGFVAQTYQNPLTDMNARFNEIRYLYEDQDRQLALLDKKIKYLKSRVPQDCTPYDFWKNKLADLVMSNTE